MLQLTTIKCPNCNETVSYLMFYKKIGNIYFHICEECLSGNDKNDLLIGYKQGWKDAIKESLEIIQKFGPKDLGESA